MSKIPPTKKAASKFQHQIIISKKNLSRHVLTVKRVYEVLRLCLSHPDHSVTAERHQLSILQRKRLDAPRMAVPPFFTADLHLDGVSVPQQQVAPVCTGHHLTGKDKEIVSSSSIDSQRWYINCNRFSKIESELLTVQTFLSSVV